MARRRFFVDFVRDGQAELRGDEAHHLGRVLRAETGQQYEISDGNGVYLAEIREAGKSVVRFQILEQLPAPAALPSLTLYMALIKFDRFEWVVEKATELGATSIVPVECARSEAGLMAASVKRSERWRKIARESSQQARRVACPIIQDSVRLTSLQAEGVRCRMEEQHGAIAFAQLLNGVPAHSALSILVGPEGGWTESERSLLDGAGWLRASLGPLILRAETAAIATLAIAGQRASANGD